MSAAADPAVGVSAAASRRRSIRAYAAEPVPRADIEAILHVASLAPSAFNIQPWRFFVVEDGDAKAALVEAAFRQRQVASAPAIVVLYTDTADALAHVDDTVHPATETEARERAVGSVRKALGGKTGPALEAWGAAQGYLALGYLLLAAEERGYQTSPMLGFDAERVKVALGLPAHVSVPALVAIGRGTEEGRPHHRQPLARLVRFV